MYVSYIPGHVPPGYTAVCGYPENSHETTVSDT